MTITGTKEELVALWRLRASRLRDRIKPMAEGKRDSKKNELLRTEAWALDQCANDLECWVNSQPKKGESK